MTSFTAIDFETAHPQKWSICQVGLVRVENGIVSEKISLLVQPPNNFYWGKFIDIHGITPEQTITAPTFEIVWQKIEPFIKEQIVVAHNGFAFDFPCLKNALAYYDITEPRYQKHCTYKLYKKNLATLCQENNITLNHHDALSDANACAELFNLYLRRNN
jgi:DNA polymerase-3 subunit epsilon